MNSAVNQRRRLTVTAAIVNEPAVLGSPRVCSCGKSRSAIYRVSRSTTPWFLSAARLCIAVFVLNADRRWEFLNHTGLSSCFCRPRVLMTQGGIGRRWTFIPKAGTHGTYSTRVSNSIRVCHRIFRTILGASKNHLFLTTQADGVWGAGYLR